MCSLRKAEKEQVCEHEAWEMVIVMDTLKDNIVTGMVNGMEVMTIGEKRGEVTSMSMMEDILSTLCIEGTAATWEQEEHDWMDNMAREQLTRFEVDCDAWFGYEEERKAHEELETMLVELEEMSLEEVPEPTLSPNPTAEARCKHCAKWMIKNIREIEWPDIRLSAELISLIFKNLNESSCSLRLICSEDQTIETLNDMREIIVSCQGPLTSKLTI